MLLQVGGLGGLGGLVVSAAVVGGCWVRAAVIAVVS
ncbi:hypothetical protein SAMN05421541_101673 [Actinoplanes philippinensis]|uniref:Uncharacterized protein n=1 Tax=Actinoplanes philippinensis TaxID=35752 RepID=A0A1I2AET1_9ACTN|nr:hypothetical protein SAMN05421541_101673 [Actinoplanes philippinensis]